MTTPPPTGAQRMLPQSRQEHPKQGTKQPMQGLRKGDSLSHPPNTALLCFHSLLQRGGGETGSSLGRPTLVSEAALRMGDWVVCLLRRFTRERLPQLGSLTPPRTADAKFWAQQRTNSKVDGYYSSIWPNHRKKGGQPSPKQSGRREEVVR